MRLTVQDLSVDDVKRHEVMIDDSKRLKPVPEYDTLARYGCNKLKRISYVTLYHGFIVTYGIIVS